MSEQTYDDGRARNLAKLLRALSDHIRRLDAEGRLLANPAELTRKITTIQTRLITLAKDKTEAVTASVTRAKPAEARDQLSRAS